MTVTELREALQKLEAEGKGPLMVAHWAEHRGNQRLEELYAVAIENAVEDNAEKCLRGPVVVLGY